MALVTKPLDPTTWPLNNATVAMFERHGFTRERRLGKNHWVVSREIAG